MGRAASGLAALLLVVMVVPPAASQPPAEDTLFLVSNEVVPSNADIAVVIAQDTFIDSAVPRVLIARDDRFADGLASGILQDTAPLLLIPPAGPIPPNVAEEIGRLGVSEAIVLGGEAAVSPAVQAELEGLGLAVQRRQGASRFETAIAVAATDAPQASTALLARAFPSPGGPESQGFADALAAGGIAARFGYPILLTETERLTQSTADYIGASAITRVLVLGGTAAISQPVEADLADLGVTVQRVGGASRADTAVAIAAVGAAESAADVDRVIVTDGQGENAWAAGFALAAHAARFNAPIVLTTETGLPTATEEFLSSGVGGDPAVAPVITCAVIPTACEPARIAAGLPPAPAPALPAQTLAAGGGHTCGLATDGAAYCWGSDENGQLGDGVDDNADEPGPVPVAGGLTFTQLTAGLFHTCGLATDSSAYCWGWDGWGQLGDGPDGNADEPVPVPVAGGLTFTQLIAGTHHTCGLATGGAAYCWGNNSERQLGNGMEFGPLEPTPVPVVGGLEFTVLAAGAFHSCGLAAGRTAYCWGSNFSGERGDGPGETPPRQASPVPVVGGLTFTQLTAGGNHTCGLVAGGTAYCWGSDVFGELGDGPDDGDGKPAPVPVAGGLTFTQLTAGSAYTCGLATGGTAYCWGNDGNGQLGDGPDQLPADEAAPVPVAGGLTFAHLTAGTTHACGLVTGGTAYCWGSDGNGELGDGADENTGESAPVPVTGGLIFQT